ncbi:two-component system, sensor histidine kinase YesM [Paenibacillus sp. 1_12]|uniref:sensor histidine kinase n=1 Tax=Paenibacillus sp. 1_12 TaxID=1566278 RepID=UPI0008E859C7|nr:sensor histidine kinase [Paenibacillus sp. 1_12]SFM22013.1 two-component system, sensor histidine kinase YesM [Paenibacillus sp. 1_12]
MLWRRVFVKFLNFGLERKVWIMTSIVVLIAVPLTGLFSYNQAAKILEVYAYNAAEQTVKQLSDSMNAQLKSVSHSLYLINASEEMKKTMEWVDGKSEEKEQVITNRMYSLFSRIRLLENDIRTIYMHTPKGEFYEGLPYEKKTISFHETPYYSIINGSLTNRWIYLDKDPLFAGAGPIISLISKPAYISDVGDIQSYLVLTLAADKYLQNLRDIQLVPEGFSMILDDKGRPILQSSPDLSAELLKHADFHDLQTKLTHFDVQVGGQTYLVNHRDIPFSNWRAVIVQPKNRLLALVQYIKYFSFFMTVTMLVVSFFLIRLIVRWVNQPLRNLQMLMNRVKEGDLNVRFLSNHQDEIGELGSRFNEMLSRIEELIMRVKEEGEAKRTAEMRVLQAQINPHFLYNTLDELYWRSLDFQDRDASEMILTLSGFFRLSLNQGDEETTVAKEMEHVTQYLKLVNFQYKRQFSFEILTDDQTKNVAVPKIILQPLVENSILHAFKQNNYSDHRIIVSSRREEQGVTLLTAEDNGCGLLAEMVDFYNRPLQEAAVFPSGSETIKGFAISNIRGRLWRFFGDRVSFNVISSDQGTRVEIRIFDERNDLTYEGTVG